jgi:hypothetical protein
MEVICCIIRPCLGICLAYMHRELRCALVNLLDKFPKALPYVAGFAPHLDDDLLYWSPGRFSHHPVSCSTASALPLPKIGFSNPGQGWRTLTIWLAQQGLVGTAAYFQSWQQLSLVSRWQHAPHQKLRHIA